MILRINGADAEVPDGTDAESLISFLGYRPERVALEIDGRICPRASRPTTVLEEGQRIEIVSFVGGG